MSKTSAGKIGEEIAAKFLSENGYKIIEKNFHSRFGEIDLIAIKDSYLVYIEVKTRWSHRFGLPEEAVNYWKLSSIEKTADYFRSTRKNLPALERIDVVAIELEGEKVKRIEILENVSTN